MSEFSRWSTSSIICAPFLDTDFDPAQRAAMIEELRHRGYPRPVVFLLRVVAGLGLWWNIIAWEWAHLDLYDVLLGYGIIFFLAALVLGIATVYTLIGGGSTSLFATLTLVSSVISVSLFILVKRGYAKSRNDLGEERAA